MTETFSTEPRYSLTREESLAAPIAVYVLYLIALPSVGLSAVIGLILAYVLRGEAGPIARSHFTFLIRTFWLHLLLIPIGVLLILCGIPLMLVGIGFVLIALGGIMCAGSHLWYLLRCLVGLVRAAGGDAYPNPRTWLL